MTLPNNTLQTHDGDNYDNSMSFCLPCANVSLNASHEISRLIPDATQLYIDLALFFLVSGLLSIHGIFTNIVNIIIFYKQSLKDSSTISLFALSIYDLGTCVTALFVCGGVGMNRLLGDGGRIHIMSLVLVAGALPREIFLQLSMRTTALLSVERCLCVVTPLTVKRIFSRRNTLIVLILFHIDLLPVLVTMIASYRLVWIVDIQANMDILVVQVTDVGHTATMVHYFTNNITIAFLCIIMILVCTIRMISGLKSAKKFFKASPEKAHRSKSWEGVKEMVSASWSGLHQNRQENVSEASNNSEETVPAKGLSVKELRLVKMVVYVAFIFTTCNLPYMAVVVAEIVQPEIDEQGQFPNLNNTLYGILYVFASFNASANFWIYRSMSSNFKQALSDICGVDKS